jgi:uncharacterized cupin superfamily protein
MLGRVRVTHRDDKPLREGPAGVRRALLFDAAEGAEQLSIGYAELQPGSATTTHRHWVGSGPQRRAAEEALHVLEGSGVVNVGGEERPLGPGAFCVMAAGEYHAVRNTGSVPLRMVIVFAGTNVEAEPKP